jgi:formylglycine-generating enzyme required for sulfatase activity
MLFACWAFPPGWTAFHQLRQSLESGDLIFGEVVNRRLCLRKPLLLSGIDDIEFFASPLLRELPHRQWRQGRNFQRGLFVWRKLFIVCMLGAFSLAAAAVDGTAYPSGETVTHSIPAAAAHGHEDRRIALLIGNAAYPDSPLANPINDVRAMSTILAAQGFEILHYENLSAQQMKEALRSFNTRLRDGGLGLFYFSGHGFQLADSILLASTAAKAASPARLQASSIDLRTVLAGMSAPRPAKRNVVILDTCLNNPFGTGVSPSMKLPAQTLIGYATSPGAFAADGAFHGVYTGQLMQALAVPGLDAMTLFERVASSVARLTGHAQLPRTSSTLASDTVLATQALPPSSSMQDDSIVALRSRAILPKDSAEQYELAFWDTIKDSDHAADYEAYLQAYPKGRFAALAKARIQRLQAAGKDGKPAASAPKAPERAPAAKKPPKEPPAQTQPAPAAPPPAPRAAGSNAAATEIKDCATCPPLVSLPAGPFTMGSNSGDPSEKPPHRVTIATPFAIGKYEVTIEQWNACVEAGGCSKAGADAKGAPNTPVRDVSWDDAQQYVKWLSKLSGKSYRLPTEAEWEYAARGGTTTRFWWGEKMESGKADCKDCGPPWTQSGPLAVGSFAANPFGLHDVNGSVWEWVEDCWHNSYKGAPANGHAWETPSCHERVIRGGSWREGASYMPSSTRFKYAASVRDGQNGFRVARDAK